MELMRIMERLKSGQIGYPIGQGLKAVYSCVFWNPYGSVITLFLGNLADSGIKPVCKGGGTA